MHHDGEQLELKLQSVKSKAWPTRFENGVRRKARNNIVKKLATRFKTTWKKFERNIKSICF